MFKSDRMIKLEDNIIQLKPVFDMLGNKWKKTASEHLVGNKKIYDDAIVYALPIAYQSELLKWNSC